MLKVLKITQNNCPACSLLSYMIDDGVDFPVEELNIDELDQEKRKEVIGNYDLMGTPVLIFEKDGEVVDRLNGIRGVNPEVINELIEKHL